MTPAPPAWVRKRDGRLEPFEADRISRALFAACESCGRPDAFLARELADVVVHFLSEESEGAIPTTATVREVVVKVLRELRQHELAHCYAVFSQQRNTGARASLPSGTPGAPREESAASVRDACLRDYSLRTVFTRDLAAAHRDGLIALGGLELPCALHSCLVDFGVSQGVLGRLQMLAATPCQVAVIGSAEYALASTLSEWSSGDRANAERATQTFLEELDLVTSLCGRAVVLNLNGPAPQWYRQGAEPLFPGSQEQHGAEWPREVATLVADIALRARDCRTGKVGFHWHLSERDFADSDRDHLMGLARLGVVSDRLTFVFDRPRLPDLLAEGASRSSPSVLLSVGLNLALLAQLPDTSAQTSEFPAKAERFLVRLKSLARLALSAAIQKRMFLRRQAADIPELARGLLVERSSLLVVPKGLEAALALLGHESDDREWIRTFGCAVMRELVAVLGEEGRAVGLETSLDVSSCWDGAVSVQRQLEIAGAFQQAAGGGTACVVLPADSVTTREQAAEWLRWAWKKTTVRRVRFVGSSMNDVGDARGLFRSEREP